MNMNSFAQTVQILNGTNFSEWNDQVQFSMGLMDLDTAIREKQPAAITDASSEDDRAYYEMWDRANRLSLMFMKLTIANNIKSTLPETKNAKEYLKNIEEHFKTADKSLADFQSYAKPSRLFPAKEVKVCPEFSPEKIFTSFRVDGSQSLYKRIPASSMKDYLRQSDDPILSNMLHFQRGYVDEFTFEGPKLGKVEALWIGIESGQWRLGHASMTIIYEYQTPLEEPEEKENKYIGFQYDFEVDDILLGEGSNMSMAELRPSLVTELSGINPFTLICKNSSEQTFTSDFTSNEESMKEYADLKFSLLLYDTMLILTGTSIASFTAGESSALAFLSGGIFGFLYLFLLQRSVDGLPAPGGDSDEIFGGFKSPIPGLALVLGLTLFVIEYGRGDVSLALTPKEVIVGMMGFISCKVAVVLAAFKPLPMGLMENKGL